MSQPRAAALGQGVADAAHADDAERPAGEVLAEMAERLPRLPLAGQAVVVPLDEPAGGGDQQAEGHVGGGVGQHAGRVADGDAAGRGRRDVDVVEADRVVADHLEARRGVEQGGVDAVGEQRHQAVAVGDLLRRTS